MEEKTYQLEISKLKLDYSKHLTTLFVALLSGQITLISTVFKSREDFTHGYLSIVFMFLACLVGLSYSESVLRKLELSKDKTKTLKALKVVDTFKSIVGGTFLGLSIYFFVIFVFPPSVT